MSKKIKHAYSAYSKDAMRLLGASIRAERKVKKMTEQDLADRVGVSRSFIWRLEKGDMRCEIGAVFEAANIVGIPLFDMEPSRLAVHTRQVEDKLKLLPKAIHKKEKVIAVDF